MFKIAKSHYSELETLKSWFPDKKSSYQWSGPGLRYPFTSKTFLEDIYWEKIPSYSLLSQKSELAGFGQYFEKCGRCHLARLAISPNMRGRGAGKQFISELMKIGLADLETEECSLFVLNSNSNALKCYRSLGFIKSEYPPDQAVFHNIDFMVKSISDASKNVNP